MSLPLALFQSGWIGQVLLSLALLAWSGLEIHAQLAVTEVMSWASTNHNEVWEEENSDFWELTNFGDNSIDLEDYMFCDRDKSFPEAVWRLPAVTIGPEESIIFLRGDGKTTNEAAFRQWWGESNLPANLQIIVYPNNPISYGFNELGDAVRFWDSQSNLVDYVEFGEATRGKTFTIDEFGGMEAKSEEGKQGAFRATEYDDTGSPGWAPQDPIPLHISNQPLSPKVDAGAEVTFSITAIGLPRPRGYIWHFNGVPTNNVPTQADSLPVVVNYAGFGLAWKIPPKPTDLTIPIVQPEHQGEYFVVVTNGLDRATSEVVRLTVNTNPAPPVILLPPQEAWFPGSRTNLAVMPGQTARFAVLAGGYPPPAFEWSWSSDGVSFSPLLGETRSTFEIPNALEGHAGVYQVRVSNSQGETLAFASLTVTPKPALIITEAMPWHGDCEHGNSDWWELTNTGDEPVNLYGYRWDDSPGSLGGGPTITNNIVVQPGESVIFLENLGPGDFIRWWGADNLPQELQLISYSANSLSEKQDVICLWNPTANPKEETIDSVGFSDATKGVSYWFDPDLSEIFPYGIHSMEGQCGAFRAANGCDVGSPGWTRWTPPRLISVRRVGSLVTLEWKAQPGSTNRVEYTTRPELYLSHVSGNRVLSWINGAAVALQSAESVEGPWTKITGAVSPHSLDSLGTQKFFRLATVPDAQQWADLGVYAFPGAKGSATHTNSTSACSYRVVRFSSDNCPCEDLP